MRNVLRRCFASAKQVQRKGSVVQNTLQQGLVQCYLHRGALASHTFCTAPGLSWCKTHQNKGPLSVKCIGALLKCTTNTYKNSAEPLVSCAICTGLVLCAVRNALARGLRSAKCTGARGAATCFDLRSPLEPAPRPRNDGGRGDYRGVGGRALQYCCCGATETSVRVKIVYATKEPGGL